jgi:monomeric sarcosine oxidase
VTTLTTDVLIVGGGTMGTAAAWALAKRGVRATVLEQFSHVHALGSHGGHTRIFRHAYSEGAAYVPLMRRADALWQQLAEALGLDLVHRTGILEMDAPGGHHAHTARTAGDLQSIPYEWLTADEIRHRWPAFDPPDGWEGGYSDRAGFLEVEPALKGMAVLARRLGAQFREQTPVLAWGTVGASCWAETPGERFTDGGLLRELGLPLTVVRKVLFWLDVEDPAPFRPDCFPVFAADTGGSEVYGFPIFGLPGMKVANHLGGETVSPDTVDRSARDGEASDILDCTRRLLPGVSDRVIGTAACLYTRTPDEHFIIDRHPEHPRVVFAAGFSGHGFKFATEIGEHLADLALDERAQPYDLFRADRFSRV